MVSEGKVITYLYIELVDEYEFSNDFWSKDNKKSFVYNLKEYITKFLNNIHSDSAVLIINGIMIGTMSLSVFLNNYFKSNSEDV